MQAESRGRLERSKTLIEAAISGLENGESAEFGRFDPEGTLLDWSDRFRPFFPGDELDSLGNGLYLLRSGEKAWFTHIKVTPEGKSWFQNRPMELMDGPYRFHQSPIQDVALSFDSISSIGNPVSLDSVSWKGAHIAYLVTDNIELDSASPQLSSWLVWLWTLAATACLLVFFIWVKAVSPAKVGVFMPMLLLVMLPEWILGFRLMELTGEVSGYALKNPAMWNHWIHAICYSVAALLLSQQILKVKRFYGFTWYPRTIGFSIAYGAIGGFSIIGLARAVYRLSISEPFQVLGIDIMPDSGTLMLYYGAALLTASLLLTLILVGWFLMNTESDQLKWMHGFSLAGFAYSLAVGYSVTVSLDPRIFIISATTGIIVYALAFGMHRRADTFRQLSPFRQLILATIAVSSFLYPIFHIATQALYDEGLTELAVSTATYGINPKQSFGLQSPYRISLYEDGERINRTGDYSTGQFNDRKLLFQGYSDLQDNGLRHRTVDGPFFRYQEIAAKKGADVAVVSARIPNVYNHMFSYFRLIILLIGLGLIAYPVLQFVTGNQIALFRGRERFEYRILDTYIITSFLFLVALVILSRQIIVNQNSARVELDLINTLDILSVRLDSIQEPDLDYFLYENNRLTYFTELYQFEGILPTPLIPKSVHDVLFVNGQDRGFYRSESAIGPLTVVFKKLDDDRVIAIPANLNANKYMDEILQTTSFTIIVYLAIFGLFIGGTVFISRELMHPIHEFRTGLQRIAAGQLDTLIPVKTKDEIGELANAYNLMVFKLKDLQDELADKERQTAWSEMARQVAHEIKNPLTPMKLSIQHLYQQIQFGDKTMDEVKPMIAKISETLIREIDSLNNIANDFSKFARPITEDFAIVDLNKSVQSILNLYQHDRRLYLWTDLSEAPLPVFAAQDELKRVLLNLVKNAMEALPKGGIVVIRTYRYHDDAYVEVIDNGSGIEEELKSRIFVPNFSTKNTGTGLGLAICKKVVEAHHGRIEFASAAGLGTTFTIRIPLSQDV